jgi:hypothetical protein
MAELAFETLAGALEATRGTAVSPPTHTFPLVGTIEPADEWYRPEEARGTLVRAYREQRVRQAATWSAEGGLDPLAMPFFLNMTTGAGVIATPGGGTNARTHTHKPAISSDAIKTATLYYGDPNTQIWQADFAYANELTITADGSGTDGATMTISGGANPPVEVAAPTFPAQTIGGLLMPSAQQVWIDTASIGTTAITGRVISSEFTLTNNIVQKFLAVGPGGSLTYSRIGRGRPEVSGTVTMDLVDTTQMDQILAGTHVMLRVRISGDLIEAALYEYVQWDVYGRLKFDSWGDLEGTNRTVTMRVDSLYDSTLGADYQIVVQNDSATV